MKCPTCGAELPPGLRFCERDGTRLVPAGAVPTGIAPASAPACRCGASDLDEDGFCSVCGRQRDWPDLTGRDHLEQAPSPMLGGVSDRGRRHSCNEDALVLGMDEIDGQPVYMLVVCDGVSSAQGSQQASQAAADAACTALLESLRAGSGPEATMRKALHAAQQAVCAQARLTTRANGKTDPPSTTIVAALVHAGLATIGWVGDSRAYRLGPDGSVLLSHDHSWVNDQVDSGTLTLEQALAAPERNAITLWLGPSEDGHTVPDPEPGLASAPLGPGEQLLLCSDGLWKYAPAPEALARLAAEPSAGATPIEVARHLVAYANQQGGSDNITVALLSLPAPNDTNH